MKTLELGISHFEQGNDLLENEKYEEAIVQYDAALLLLKKAKSEDTLLYIMACHQRKGVSYTELEQYSQAIIDFTAVIEIGETLGDVSVGATTNLGITYSQRALVYLRCKRLDEALIDQAKALKFLENIKDLDTQEVMNETYVLIGDSYANLDTDADLENAIQIYTKAAELYQAIQGYETNVNIQNKLGELHSNIGNVYGQLAEHELSIVNYKTAIGYCQALEVLNPSHGTKGNMAHVYTCMAFIVSDSEDFADAIGYRSKAIELYTTINDQDEFQLEILSIYANRAYDYAGLENLAEAIADCTKLAEGLEAILTPTAPKGRKYLADTYFTIGLMYLMLKKQTEMNSLFEKATKEYKMIATYKTDTDIQGTLRFMQTDKRIIAEDIGMCWEEIYSQLGGLCEYFAKLMDDELTTPSQL